MRTCQLVSAQTRERRTANPDLALCRPMQGQALSHDTPTSACKQQAQARVPAPRGTKPVPDWKGCAAACRAATLRTARAASAPCGRTTLSTDRVRRQRRVADSSSLPLPTSCLPGGCHASSTGTRRGCSGQPPRLCAGPGPRPPRFCLAWSPPPTNPPPEIKLGRSRGGATSSQRASAPGPRPTRGAISAPTSRAATRRRAAAPAAAVELFPEVGGARRAGGVRGNGGRRLRGGVGGGAVGVCRRESGNRGSRGFPRTCRARAVGVPRAGHDSRHTKAGDDVRGGSAPWGRTKALQRSEGAGCKKWAGKGLSPAPAQGSIATISIAAGVRTVQVRGPVLLSSKKSYHKFSRISAKVCNSLVKRTVRCTTKY